MSADRPVLRHFSGQLLRAVGIPDKTTAVVKKQRWRVGATAVAYFWRFYSVYSLLDHDPRLIMLVSLFLAGKTEESFVNLADLQKIYSGFSESRLLGAEILLLEALQFELKVFHPQNLVHAVAAEIKRMAPAPSGDVGQVEAEADRARWAEAVNAWDSRASAALLQLQEAGVGVGADEVGAPLCPRSVAAGALRLTEPQGEGHAALREALTIVLQKRLGAEVAAADCSVLERVRALLAEAQTPPDVEALTARMREVKAQNRWEKSKK